MSRHFVYTWSTPMWHSFHLLAANCEDIPSEIEHIKSILAYFALIIPCIRCKVDAMGYIKRGQASIKTKNDLIMFCFNFHNYVRQKTNRVKTDKKILNTYINKDKKTIKKTIDTTLNLCKSGTRAIPRYQKLMNGRVNSINRIFANLKIK